MKDFKIILSSITIFLLINTLVFAQGNVEEEFRERNGEEWIVGSYPWGYINLAARVRPEDVGSNITEEEALDIGEDFMSLNKDLFGIETLKFYDVKIKGYEEHRSWVVFFTGDVYEGLPVTEIDMRLLMTLDGQIFGAGDVEVCTIVFESILQGYYPIPEIPEDEAINPAESGGERPEEANLKYIPSSETEDFKYMLAWELTFDNKKVILDAMNGSVLSTETIEPTAQKKGYMELIKASIFLIICITGITAIVLLGMFLLKKRKVSILHESNNLQKNEI